MGTSLTAGVPGVDAAGRRFQILEGGGERPAVPDPEEAELLRTASVLKELIEAATGLTDHLIATRQRRARSVPAAPGLLTAHLYRMK